MLLRKFLLRLGCLFGAVIFAKTPSSAQTLEIRLFEIFHPQILEISSGANQPSRRDQHNFLIVAPSLDTLRRVRIVLTPIALQVESDKATRSFSLADTIRIVATAGYFFMTPNEGQPGLAVPRRYSGALKIYVTGKDLCIINKAPVEDYLAGVLASEMPKAAFAALEAQAVVARTYMHKNWLRHQKDSYQFCDLTHCQVYKGDENSTDQIKQAINKTKNEILVYQSQPIEAYYSSTCGGRTADDNGVWANQKDQPYLTSRADSNFCANSPHYRWRVKISADSLHQIWQRRLGELINSIMVSKKGADGRALELALMGHSLHLITGEDFRAVTCRVFGWNTIKSTAFDLRIEKKMYIFIGRGLGHGLGLCQYGAMEMARRGYSYQKILRHYFPETEIEKETR
jgi:stage II sporulation protein D